MTLLTQLLESFVRHKPGIWGEPAWYVALITAWVLLVVALLAYGFLIARQVGSKKVCDRYIWLLLGIAGVQGLFYSSVTPPWQAPDEHAHYEYAALMGELNRVPGLTDVRQDIQAEVTLSMFHFDFWRLIQRQPVESPPVGFYRAGDLIHYPPTHVIDNRYIYYPQVGNEPPMYYIFPALLYKLTYGQDATYRMYTMRLASVLIWVALIAAVWWATQALFPTHPWISMAVSAVVVFNPMLGHIGTVLNNDGLAALWTTLALGVLALMYRNGLGWRTILPLSGLIVLAVLTKKSTFWLVPAVVFALLLLPQIPYRWRLGIGLSLVGIGLLVFGLFLWPTGEARHWQGGILARDVEDPSNQALLIGQGEQAAQRLSRQRVSQVQGQNVVGQARLRGNRPAQISVCLVTEADTSQCQEIAVDPLWHSVAISWTIPEQPQGVQLVFEADGLDQLWIDDVAMVAEAENDLIRNGPMESGVSWLERILTIIGQPLGIGNLVTGLFSNFEPQFSRIWGDLPTAWQIFFDSFWGNFGAAMVVPLLPPWPLITRIAVLLGGLGYGLSAIRRSIGWLDWQGRMSGVLSLALGLALFQTFLPLMAHSGGWMPQGRFLFPAIWPVATLLVIGWIGWAPRRARQWVALCITLAMLTLYLGGTWRLISYFHG